VKKTSISVFIPMIGTDRKRIFIRKSQTKMNANEFNDLAAQSIEEQLAALGFRQQTVHFFIHRPPNIMVLHKKTGRGLFQGFYLALTHDFMSNVTFKKEKLKVPSYLEEYPFSIALSDLPNQYAKHRSARDFSYDTNFLTREVHTTGRLNKKDPFAILGFQSLLSNGEQAQMILP
jgi:hypothetical protein